MIDQKFQMRNYLTEEGIKHWTDLTEYDCECLNLDWQQVQECQRMIHN